MAGDTVRTLRWKSSKRGKPSFQRSPREASDDEEKWPGVRKTESASSAHLLVLANSVAQFCCAVSSEFCAWPNARFVESASSAASSSTEGACSMKPGCQCCRAVVLQRDTAGSGRVRQLDTLRRPPDMHLEPTHRMQRTRSSYTAAARTCSALAGSTGQIHTRQPSSPRGCALGGMLARRETPSLQIHVHRRLAWQLAARAQASRRTQCKVKINARADAGDMLRTASAKANMTSL
jgi:hypothetical protein